MQVQAEKNTDNWTRSRELLKRARRSLSGGVSSPFRAKTPVPHYFEDGCGCRLRDADGNGYIEYAPACGPLILGDRRPGLVNRYLIAALKEGLYLLPDGRIYVSAVHYKAGIEETIAKFDQAFSTL